MSKKRKPKEYEISSFEHLFNVLNRKNFESLTTDLLLWVGFCLQTIDMIRKANPAYCKDKSNWDLCKFTFIWIDDGKNDMKGFTVKNQLTGEIKKFKVR